MTATSADTAQQTQDVVIRSRMAQGKAFVRKNINKLITIIGSIVATAIAYTTHRAKSSPINIKKMMAIATLFMLQKLFADRCDDISRDRTPTALDARVAQYLPNNPTRRQNLLLFSFFAKLNLSLYAFKTLQIRMPLRIAVVAGLTAIFKKNYKAERGMITRTLTAQDSAAKQQLQVLELRVARVLRNFCDTEDQVEGLQQHFTTSHLQGPHVVFSGFGRSWTLRPDEDLTAFNTDIQPFIEVASTNPRIGLDAVWLRTDSAELYQTRQEHFKAFERLYSRSNEQDRAVMETFAKIYPFDEAVGSFEDMQTFIHHHKERRLIAAQPKLAETIRSLYATPCNIQAHNITTTAYMMRQLCDDMTASLIQSKQRGSLTPDCAHQLTLLLGLIDPEDQANQPLLRALDEVNQETITHLNIRKLQTQITRLKGNYEQGNLPLASLDWLHNYILFPRTLDDRNSTNLIERISSHLTTARQMQHLTATSDYLQGLLERAEEAQEKCGKCKRLTKQVGKYTAITTGAAAALYLGVAPWIVVPATLYTVPAVKKRLDRAINTQVRNLTDTGQNSVERALGNASAQVSRFMNAFSLKTQLHQVKRSIAQSVADTRARVMRNFSAEVATE